MASIVRSGAGRLAQRAPAAGGLLQAKAAAAAGALSQRTQASGVDALRLPFVARFMMSSTRQHARAPPESRAKAVDKIQAKKEELYDLISLTENSVHTNSYNRYLLQSLSAQIKPRPDDSEWRFMRASKRRSDVIRPAGIVLGFCLGSFSILLMRGMDAARAEEMAQTVIKEQQEEKAAKEKEVAPKEKELALA